MASFGTLTIEGPVDATDPNTQEYHIKPGPNRIGRSGSLDGRNGGPAKADLELPDKNVSADHALITAVATGCYITDMGSRYGTTVDGTPLLQQTSRLLRDGETISIGPFKLRYRHSVALSREMTWGRSTPVLRPDVAARQWQAERERQARPISDIALFQRERKELRRAPSEYLQYLPWIYQESDLINELLLTFQETWRSIDEILDAIHWYSHPMLAPEGLLDWLAGWFSIVLDATSPIARRRDAIRHAVELFQWRGTAYGLKKSIVVLTGFSADIVEPGQEAQKPPLNPALQANEFCVVARPPKPRPIYVRAFRPTSTRPAGLIARLVTRTARASANVRAIRRIIEHGRPVHATYRLMILRKWRQTYRKRKLPAGANSAQN